MISGSGTNLQAVIDAISAGTLAAQIVLVVSNRKAAYGLVRAVQAGIPTLYAPRQGTEREAYDAALADQVGAAQPDLIVLAGWMHILSRAFLDRFPGRIINLHPALPGAFPGTEAIQRAYDAHKRGEITHSGCMVHYVVPEIDAGEVIASVEVPILDGDSLEDFEARMHAAEHTLIVEAIRKALERRLHQ